MADVITRTMAEEIAKELKMPIQSESLGPPTTIFWIHMTPDNFQAALNLAVQRAVGEPVAYMHTDEFDITYFVEAYCVKTESENLLTPLYALANTEGE